MTRHCRSLPASSVISGSRFRWQIATQSALQLLDSNEFDLVLSDIGLPDGSGYEVVAKAKQKQPVKAVALTGLSAAEDIRRSKEAGFDFHLTKPVDFFELRTLLNQLGPTDQTPAQGSPSGS